MDKLEDKVAIIGIGNMGQAIVSRFLKQRLVSKKNLFLSNCSEDNKKVVRDAEIIILAIKPNKVLGVLSEIKDAVVDSQLIVSIVAGVEIKTIKKLLNKNQPIVRVMPNLCASIGKSISVWVNSVEVTRIQKGKVKKILKCLGKEVLIEKESDLNKVTAISGSGPAYLFYLVELLEQSAIKIGINKDIARKLARQTIIGSTYLLENSNKKVKTLRKEVTSRGGTTESAFKQFEKGRLKDIYFKGIEAAFKKSCELNYA